MSVVSGGICKAFMELRRMTISTALPLRTTTITRRRYTKTVANAVLLPRYRNSSRQITLPALLRPLVIVYDGHCHLSRAGIPDYNIRKFCATSNTGMKWVIEADKHRKIKFCCLQSETAEPYLKFSGLSRKDVHRHFLFVGGLGSYHQGAAACLKVLSYMPMPNSALSALKIIPAPLRDAAYTCGKMTL